MRGLSGAALQPGRKLEFLLLEGDLADSVFIENRDLIRDALAQLSIQITYKDLYEREHTMLESLSSFRK